MIAFICPTCRTSLTRQDNEAGEKIACPSCGQRVQIPQPPPPINKTVMGVMQPDPQNRTVLGQLSQMNVRCPHCQAPLQVPTQHGGQAMKCPTCSGLFKPPGALPSALPTPPQATDSVPSAAKQAILSILQEDDRLAKETKGDHIPKDKPSQVAAAIGRYCDLTEALDLSGCPADFRIAYRQHLRAWREAQQAAAQFPDDLLMEVVIGFFNGLLKGERDGGKGRWHANFKNAQERIRSTWEGVEKTGAKYDAAL